MNVSTSLRRLRWVAIVLPACFVLVVQGVLDFALEGELPAPNAHLLTVSILVAGVVGFGIAMFRVLEDKERTIVEQARRARALNQIGSEVSALLESDRLIDLVVDRAREWLGADGAALALLDTDGEAICWQRFPAPGSLGEGAGTIRLRARQGIAAYVASTGQPLLLPDVRAGLPQGLASAPILSDDGLRAALAVPLRSGDERLGALIACYRAPTPFGDEQVELLTSLANHVAVALANARLYARSQLTADRLERLIESSGDAIITTDLDGRILGWNYGAETIYGWTRQEAIGNVLPMVPADLVEDARDRIILPLKKGELLINYEVDRIRKDGTRIAVVVTGSPIRNAAGEIVGILGISKDMSARRQIEEQERRLALLEDRERIGMELHDGAIQSLYAVGLGLEAAAQVLESDPPLARERLSHARDAVNGVIREIRNYIFGLRPDASSERGLVEGLCELGRELKINSLVDFEADVSSQAELAFSTKRAQELFQIAREALANVGRHAAAGRAGLSLQPHGDRWMLRIWDNGVGFDPAARLSAGFGLGNMRERSRRLGGQMQVVSRPGEGTEVVLALPGDGGKQG